MKEKSRVKYCDFLRCIAIVMVIAIHIFAGIRDYYLEKNMNYYTLLTLFDSFTRVGVPIFFMLTGIFLLNDKKEISYKDFLKKKMTKLVIPFIVFLIIYYIYGCWKDNIDISIIDFLISITEYGKIKYHLWFMYAIIIIYILIPFLKVLAQHLKTKDLKNLILVIYIFGNVLRTINVFSTKYGYNILSGFCLPDIIIYINYLFLGYYLYINDIDKKQRKKLYIVGIIFILLLPIADRIFIENSRNDVLLNSGSLFPFIPAAAFFVFVKYNYDKFRIPKLLEDNIAETSPSIFYIYMVHVLVMEILNINLNKIWQPNRLLEHLMLFVILLFGTFTISQAIGFYFNKIYLYLENKIIKR